VAGSCARPIRGQKWRVALLDGAAVDVALLVPEALELPGGCALGAAIYQLGSGR
jgi:hypothetical protein